MYVQDIAIDSTKAYFTYDVSYIVCYSKWGSNLGLAEINDDGEVIIKPGTMMVKININKNKKPYFGLTSLQIKSQAYFDEH